MKHTLLFVDDEKNILNSLSRLFKNENYNILTALSAEQGLKLAEENDISLVISDHLMPGMNGVEFLAGLKEAAPKTIRILLTGYADMDTTIDAINKGEVYRYLVKPWNDKALLILVRQCLEVKELESMNKSLAKTVKKQTYILKKLEESHPGITEVERAEDGAIIIDDPDEISWEDICDSADK